MPVTQEMIDNIVAQLEETKKRVLEKGSRSEAGFVMVGTALIDYDLSRCLKVMMRKLPDSLERKLFRGYGPLNSFSSRIDLCYAFRVYEEDTQKQLHFLRKIRNEFAHSKRLIDLETEPVASFYANLSLSADTDGEARMKRLTAHVGHIDDILERFLASYGVTDDIRPKNLPSAET